MLLPAKDKQYYNYYNVIERESVIYALPLCCFICELDNIYAPLATDHIRDFSSLRSVEMTKQRFVIDEFCSNRSNAA